jgi:hypothetical protein
MSLTIARHALLCHNRICRKQAWAHPTIAACEHTQLPCFSLTIWRVRSLALLARWRLGTFVALTYESTRGTSQGILLEQTDHCGAARTREGNERDMHCLRTLGPVKSALQAEHVQPSRGLYGFVSDFLLHAVYVPHFSQVLSHQDAPFQWN